MLRKLSLVVVFLLVALGIPAFAGNSINLVPADAVFVANIEFGKLFSTELMKKKIAGALAQQPPEAKKQYDEFVQKTGFDIFKDLNGFCMFVIEGREAKSNIPSTAVIITGTIDSAKIIKAVQDDKNASANVSIEKYEGLPALKWKIDPVSMVVFFDNSTAVLGNVDCVKSMIDIKNGKGENVSTNQTFNALLKKVDTSATSWGAGFLPQAAKDRLKENPQFAPLAALKELFFTIKYEPDASYDFTFEVDKKENLEGVLGSLNGSLAQIKTMTAEFPEVAEILNTVKVDAVDMAAKISLNVSKAKLEEVGKKIEERMKKATSLGPEKK